MSRRKQARPSRHFDSDGSAETVLGNGSDIDLDGDSRRSPVEDELARASEAEDLDCAAASPAGSTTSRGESPRARLLTEESKLGALQQTLASSLSSLASLTGSPASLPSLLQALKAGGSPPSLESLQSTGLAVAQLTATAVANNTHNPAALQELAMLQSTLFTLQQQQVFQMNLIQQLQAQLQITKPSDESGGEQKGEAMETGEKAPSERSGRSERSESPTPAASPSDERQLSRSPPPPGLLAGGGAGLGVATSSSGTPSAPTSTEPLSSLASAVIQPTDDAPAPEGNSLQLLQKTTQNVLNNASQGLLANNMVDEMYRRTKPGSGGAFTSERKDQPFFKHRCRYCGKVFGSDSALQIHIRSHTGERPYKCNICGNRFTTKGNLKVHFQRHSARFPHVKMNINMVPEHLDKYYPPLLAQLGELPETPQPPVPPPHFGSPLLGPPPLYSRALNDEVADLNTPPPEKGKKEKSSGSKEKSAHKSPLHALPPLALPPPPVPSLPMPLTTGAPDWPDRPVDGQPLSLTKPSGEEPLSALALKEEKPSTPPPGPTLGERLRELESLRRLIPSNVKRPAEDEPVRNERDDAKRIRAEEELPVKREPADEDPVQPGSEADERSRDSRLSEPRDSGRSDAEDPRLDGRSESPPERPQNLSKSATSPALRASALSTLGQRMLPTFPFSFPITSLPQGHFPFPQMSVNTFNPVLNLPPDIDPAKHPNIYTNLLPKPGVNDNSWEALIEVQKTSETSKLQQLVDNIENKITDPNQCVICQRVLSCKSALQMHYRTHTGERPFKCKICSRAFTTKGNLKTHMGVHRSKPPMRVSHQCPVCHKRFHNGLLLQQHIKLHTGEPTEMTPEQIAAGEVLEPLMPMPGGFPPGVVFPAGFPLPPSHLPGFPGFPGGFPGLALHKRPPFPSGGDRHRDENGNRTKEEQAAAAANGDRSDISGDESLDSTAAGSAGASPAASPAGSGGSLRRSSPPCSPPPEDGSQPLDLTPRSSAPSAAAAPPTPPAGAAMAARPPLPGMPGPFVGSPLFGCGQLGLDTRFPGVGAFPAMRGNTTCNLCFKVFACQSALDIHYRSHTKERPFKCPRCDKGFSTKGNMKQHLTTHSRAKEPEPEPEPDREPASDPQAAGRPRSASPRRNPDDGDGRGSPLVGPADLSGLISPPLHCSAPPQDALAEAP